jgi:hypothetical protein
LYEAGTALAVLHTLIFDFLNHRTGRLDPSYAAIARKVGVRVRTVATALKRLRELGIQLGAPVCRELARWSLRAGAGKQRLCRAAGDRLAGLQAGAGAASGARTGHLGREQPTPMPSVLAQAAQEGREGGDLRSMIQTLAADPKNGLAAALASLGQAFIAHDS